MKTEIISKTEIRVRYGLDDDKFVQVSANTDGIIIDLFQNDLDQNPKSVLLFKDTIEDFIEDFGII
jgi:hypothetical protein